MWRHSASCVGQRSVRVMLVQLLAQLLLQGHETGPQERMLGLSLIVCAFQRRVQLRELLRLDIQIFAHDPDDSPQQLHLRSVA
eukprot:scaffold3038_cov250-Pinguiococcus_pyrenoidosus.AAC.11